MTLNQKLIEASERYDGLHISAGMPDATSQLLDLVAQGKVNFRVTEYAPWCSIFQCAVVEQCGGKSPRSAWAKDWLKVGAKIPLDDAEPGDICVFTRAVNYGHVTQFRRRDGDIIWCYGGNQKNSVKLSPFHVRDLLGVRRVEPRATPVALMEAPAVESEMDTAPEPSKPVTLPPVVVAETVKETEQRLRAQGSRTIAAADAVEKRSIIQVALSVLASVGLALQQAWEQLAPFAKTFGPYILLIVAFIAWEAYRESKRVKEARIDDDRNGFHTGRKPPKQEDDET